jgi:hypothetical protein
VGIFWILPFKRERELQDQNLANIISSRVWMMDILGCLGRLDAIKLSGINFSNNHFKLDMDNN